MPKRPKKYYGNKSKRPPLPEKVIFKKAESPVKIKYIDIIKKDEIKEDSKAEEIIQNIQPVIKVIPKINKNNMNYSIWKLNYLPYIIRLRDIFSKGFLEYYPDAEDYLTTAEFLDKFCLFIRNNSSGEISPFLDDIRYDLMV